MDAYANDDDDENGHGAEGGVGWSEMDAEHGPALRLFVWAAVFATIAWASAQLICPAGNAYPAKRSQAYGFRVPKVSGQIWQIEKLHIEHISAQFARRLPRSGGLISSCRIVHLDNSIMRQRVIPVMLHSPPRICVQLAVCHKVAKKPH